MTITPGYLFGLIVLILIPVLIIFMTVMTLVNHHRVMRGKEKIYKGRQREIVIVKKRVTEREHFVTGLNFKHTGPINRSTRESIRNASVDYRIVGRKLLHTKFISEDVLGKLQVGQTYKALIRFNYVEKIYPNVNN